jgi:hypothetical protein
MLLEERKIECGLGGEWIVNVGVEVDGNQTAGIIGTKGNLPAWIGADSPVTFIGITVGYGFPKNGIPE